MVNKLLWTFSTPWNIALPEKLTDPQLIKKFPAFYTTWKFRTAFKSAHNLCLYPDPEHPVHASPSHFLNVHFNIVLPSTPRCSKWCHSLRSSFRNPEWDGRVALCISGVNGRLYAEMNLKEMGSESVDWVYVIRSGDHFSGFKWFILPELCVKYV